VFMLFGAGLTAGLLGQIAEGIGSDSLGDIARVASWALPFEALYQAGLAEMTADTVGFTRLAIDLGPFGGAQSGGADLWLFSLAYLAAVGGLAIAAFARRDL
jgi:Cu-processing system permease protein